MNTYLAFNKPYGVLSQFTDTRGRATLKDYIPITGIYPAGRLDYRSEGLLLLSDDGGFIQTMSDPRFDHPKTYLVQVEGIATQAAVDLLNSRVMLPDIQQHLPQARLVKPPDIPPRPAPVRAYHPTSWLEIILSEGKKHEVRRLSAAVGFPTLRLIRITIGPVSIAGLQSGAWRRLTKVELRACLATQKSSHPGRSTNAHN